MYACMMCAFAGSAAARSAWRTARISRVSADISADPDLGLDRHSRTQAVQSGLILIESDAHREALHHLHVIPAGVFRRQQAGDGSGGSGEAFDVAAEILTVGIDANGDLLAGMNPAQLRFFEIRRDPHIVDLGDQKKLLAWLHVVTDLDIALA